MLARLLGLFVRRFTGVLIVTAAMAANTVAATPNKNIAILFADFSERAGIAFVAKDQHFFEEQGLDCDIVQGRTGTVAI